MPQMTTSDLKTLLQGEKADALSGMNESKLQEDRTKALDYYMGEMTSDVPALPGRSQAVSTDVADTVEGLMPSLMEIFCGSDEVVRFDPVGEGDEELADQETDVVNHVFMQLNDGFQVLYAFIKDALLSKLGVVKVWSEEEETEEKETYYGLTEQAIALLLSSGNVEIVAKSPTPVPPAALPPPEPIFDVEVVKRENVMRHRCMAVPPEEFGWARRARTIRDSRYCFHEPDGGRPLSELVAQGYDEDQLNSLPTYAEERNTEVTARDTINETGDQDGDVSVNKAMRPIRITEHYVRMDYKGDGKACLYRVVTGGDESEILRRDGKPDIEQLEVMPFAAMTPFIITHRVCGRSVADLVMDIQRINSVLLRGYLDNIYLSLNPRIEVPEPAATTETLDDLLTARPGGIVRTKIGGMLAPLVHTDIGPTVLPAMQYMDQKREWRTGVTRQGQGIDADSLQNQSATAVNQMYSAAQAKMKLIARIFAETGVTDMFWLLHHNIRKYGDRIFTLRLRGKWVDVDPRTWKNRNDMTVNVGLGSGGKMEQLAMLERIIGAQMQAIQVPGMVKPKHFYNSAKALVKLAGHKDVNIYFDDPGEDAEMPPPNDPEDKKAQVEMMKLQHQSQMEGAKLQAESAIKNQEFAGKMQIETIQAEADIATTNRKVEADIALAQQKFQLEKELKLLDHNMKMAEHNAQMEMTRAKHSMELNYMDATGVSDVQKHLMDIANKQEQHKLAMEKLEKTNRAKRKTKIVKNSDGSKYSETTVEE